MVRPLAPTDFPSWSQLWGAYLRFYRAEIDDQVTRASFDRLASGAGPVAGLVAVDDKGQMWGFVHLVFHPSTWSATDRCYVEDLYVDPEARGRGQARELLEAAFREADRREAGSTYWETQEFNAPARSLYDQVAHRTSFVVYER
ncbi:MAG TPA: GNAT family N-acetyltransferase [Candidatus Dormibacteraeota bacterium]|nr:GNAT family N-acetyltransferase [Candidatus Dormibacteraeota bacterium]HVC23703.1 GNAT family N-acetyltransferase [Candidatus Dormibacteraeota bacterium]